MMGWLLTTGKVMSESTVGSEWVRVSDWSGHCPITVTDRAVLSVGVSGSCRAVLVPGGESETQRYSCE